MPRNRAKRLGRNDPCPCGSGQKYKRCHLNPASDSEDVRAIISREWQDARGRGECIHHHAPDECDGGIIDAHSVQRRGGLSRIARDDHVLIFTPRDPFSVVDERGRIFPRTVGVRRATTFRGFCAKHDNETFRPIDDQNLQPTLEQLNLLAYRAFAYEYSAKVRVLAMLANTRAPDRRLPMSVEVERQARLGAMQTGFARGVDDLTVYKAKFDSLLVEQTWDLMTHVVFSLDFLPPMLVAGTTHPEFDFNGEALQDLETAELPEALFVSVVPDDEAGGVVALSWFSEHSAPRRLVESMVSLGDSEIPDALLRFVFTSFENVPISPVFWDSLSSEARDSLVERLQISLTEVTMASQFQGDGSRIAPFKVVGRETFGS